MGLFSKLVGVRPPDQAVGETVADAVRVLPGVTGHSLAYHHQQYGGGALSGVVDVADAATLLEVLRTSLQVLGRMLGDDVNRVTFYLAGRTPDGSEVLPGELGFSQPPVGRELLSRLSNP